MKIHRGRCNNGRHKDLDFRFCDDEHRYVCAFKPIVKGVETEHEFVTDEDHPPLFWPYCSKEHFDGNS